MQMPVSPPEPPWMMSLEGTPRDADAFAHRLVLEDPGMVVRVVRGERMRTSASLFGEFAAAFQFPYYFGATWPALDECLADLSWLPAAGYAVVITKSDEVLADELSDREVFWRLLSGIASEWTTGSGGRAPVPFRVMCQPALPIGLQSRPIP